MKGLLGAAKNVRNAMLFNILSFLSDKLLTEGNTVAALDELYIWLSNPTAIEYIRNCLKRVRKRNPLCCWLRRIWRTSTRRVSVR